jgi:hypothetical protein
VKEAPEGTDAAAFLDVLAPSALERGAAFVTRSPRR